jgi:transmembrane sensor
MDKQLFLSLLEKYQDGTASDAEKALAEAYYHRLEQAGTTHLQPAEEEALREKLYQQIRERINDIDAQPTVIAMKRKPYRLVAAAAVLLLMAGGAGYYLILNTPKADIGKTEPVRSNVPDVPPGKDAATLTLADGSTILLDSASGAISQQGNVTVLNMNGRLSYAKQGNNTETTQTVYNTVTTARGNQYQLVLADGSKVWLNSAVPCASLLPSPENNVQ